MLLATASAAVPVHGKTAVAAPNAPCAIVNVADGCASSPSGSNQHGSPSGSEAERGSPPESGGASPSSPPSRKRKRGTSCPAALAGGTEDGDDVIELSVGGRIFTTRRSTLRFEADSMLATLFSLDSPFGPMPTTSAGIPFLDRSPDTFALLLDYLRRAGRLVGHTSCSLDTLARLREDAEYFGLAGLASAVDEVVQAREDRRRQEEQETQRRRLEETISAEERAHARAMQAQQAAADRTRRRKVDILTMLVYPHGAVEPTNQDGVRRRVGLRRLCDDGFRVVGSSSIPDRNGAISVVLQRETGELWDESIRANDMYSTIAASDRDRITSQHDDATAELPPGGEG